MRDYQLRLDAAQRGEARYDPGRPCSYGHRAERYVSNGMCVECSRERDRRRYAELQRLKRESREAS